MPKAKDKTKGMPSCHNYFYAGTETLRNKFNETDIQRLLERCFHEITKGKLELLAEPLPEHFNVSYLCHIHRTLFKNAYEWAGMLRSTPFTFSDGSTAAMQEVSYDGWDCDFATDQEIPEALEAFDQELAEKDNLRNLTREEFINKAVEMFVTLKRIHPFVDGNESVAQVFFANLALAAGHRLEFPLATKERMMLATKQSLQHNKTHLMRDLFEDISNPDKICLLQEFMNNMKDLGQDVSRKNVIVARDGETYRGIYRGHGINGIVLENNDVYIICSKDQLKPEQLKALQMGDRLFLTTPSTIDLEKTLIPKEILSPLTESEVTRRVEGSARVHSARENLQRLCRTVYGDPKALDRHMADMIKNPDLGAQFATQIGHYPACIAPLAGKEVFGLKNQARKNAEKHLGMLCTAIMDYAYDAQYIRYAINKEYDLEQGRCRQAVERPSQSLQDLLCLPSKEQKEVLSRNSELRLELHTFMRKLEHRISGHEYTAIRHNDCKALAQSIGVSEKKAQEITDIVKKSQAAYQLAHKREQAREQTLAMAS